MTFVFLFNFFTAAKVKVIGSDPPSAYVYWTYDMDMDETKTNQYFAEILETYKVGNMGGYDDVFRV